MIRKCFESEDKNGMFFEMYSEFMPLGVNEMSITESVVIRNCVALVGKKLKNLTSIFAGACRGRGATRPLLNTKVVYYA